MFLVAAAAGWAIGNRAGLVGLIVGSAIAGFICLVIAVLAWNSQGLIEAALSLLAFNLALSLGALQKHRAAKRAASDFAAGVKPAR
jgi:hypothetical protein